ncbi:FadR/GntR family transcriptional regulator [Paraburkholderia susongensis]|uniref:Transcriptional regulator, GntR family n=1 Tax=Paraburkholderia susongensis TaxID=1515439 RepID=A0A1X7I0A6_9BURK|nr:GntR family transcriptional regulator [Paraburkholderia susongensis]SMG07524.1 transcriptional regulator, GntR family [Paraburkholderia susongensis]
MASALLELPRNFRPLQIYEQVSEKIRAEIRSGRFMPDARLPSERELASLFGVGRPAVREAIGALQNEGLVVTRRNSGTYVATNAPDVLSRGAGTTKENVDGEIQPDYSPSATLDVRLILEPAIARRAAALKKRDKLAEHYLAQMETLTDVSDPEQRALWNNSDRLFHRQLAQMTGDALLAKLAGEIAETMDQSLWKRIKDDGIFDPQRIRLYVAEHRLIYEAIVTGDADAAAFYVEQHIQRVKRDITPA